MARAKTQRLPVVGTAELQYLLDVSQPRVFQLVNKPDFPAEWVRLRATKLWLMEDIEEYAELHGRTLKPLPADWATRSPRSREKPAT